MSPSLRGRHQGEPAGGPAPDVYDVLADQTAALVIRRYSTSFGLASRLLSSAVRPGVRNVYALVRVADELVDSPRPNSTVQGRSRLLEGLERETSLALSTGHSANLVVHAFARTAARCGIGPELVTPFFASMRTDLEVTSHDADSLERYVHGSAEVVGLMCLRVFLTEPGADPADYAELAPGAQRLGAAFQKVNFLRDLAADYHGLGRCYFPGVEPDQLDDATRDVLLDDIDADLAAGAAAIPRLPAGSRRAVRAAHNLFAELSRQLRETPATTIRTQRVRVPDAVKARVLASALVRTTP